MTESLWTTALGTARVAAGNAYINGLQIGSSPLFVLARLVAMLVAIR